MRKSVVFLAYGLAAAAPLVAAAAQQARPSAQAAKFDPRAVVKEMRRIIAERYVLPERRPALDAVLAEGLSSGRYIVTDPAAFAERVNADLTRVGRDRHLNFTYSPRPASAGSPRPQGPPNAEEAERESKGRNYGVRALGVLPGNVRYLAYDGFEWNGDSSARALETAMRFLSDGDAVIIDLRRNGGGSPDAVKYLVSHFMEPNRPLMTFHMNGSATPDSTATLAEVPAGRMIGRPLYVLTSGATGSAAEEFVGHVLGYKLGEAVGGNTGGAGFRNQVIPLDGMFLFSVSVGRAVLAATGKDWEGVGHAPTIPTPIASALEVAHGRALTRLAQARSGPERERIEAISEGVLARVEPRSPALPLTAYSGSFGERKVRTEAGKLYYQLGERPRALLVPLGGNAFTFEDDPSLRLQFAQSGSSVTAFEIGRPGLPPQGRYERTQ